MTIEQAARLIRADAARWRRGEYPSGCSLIVRLLISGADPSMIATCRAALSGSESAIQVCAREAVAAIDAYRVNNPVNRPKE